MYIRANRLFAQRKSRYDAIKINERHDRIRYLILRTKRLFIPTIPIFRQTPILVNTRISRISQKARKYTTTAALTAKSGAKCTVTPRLLPRKWREVRSNCDPPPLHRTPGNLL